MHSQTQLCKKEKKQVFTAKKNNKKLEKYLSKYSQYLSASSFFSVIQNLDFQNSLLVQFSRPDFPVQKVHKVNLSKSKPRSSAGKKTKTKKKKNNLEVVNQQGASGALENRRNKSIPVCSPIQAKCFLKWHAAEANTVPKNTN